MGNPKNKEHWSQDQLLLTKRGRDWLSGFRRADWDIARRLVDGLTLVPHAAFSRAVEDLVRAEAEVSDGPIALFSVREIKSHKPYFDQATKGRYRAKNVGTVDAVGRGADIGSEGLVSNLLRNIQRSESEDKFLSHPSIRTMRSHKCRKIVLVDDLVGSGKRVTTFLESMWQERTIRSWWSLDLIRFVVIAFAATDAGTRLLKRTACSPNVVADRDCPTFHELPWPSQMKKKIVRLCSTYSKETNKRHMSLGYRDQMASLVFEHGCPNNVPAILWAQSADNRSWQPLFPNRSVTADQGSVFPPEIVRRDPISVLVEAGQPNLARGVLPGMNSTSPRAIWVLLALIAKGIRRNSALSYATGLSNAELELELVNCMGWGYLTSTRRITSAGLAELHHARRLPRVKLKDAEVAKEDYYPRMLRGPTDG